MVEIPKRIKRPFTHYKDTAQAVKPDIPLDQLSERVKFARQKARSAAEAGDVSEQLRWEVISEGLEG